jgi:hypothetical protein
MRSTPCRLLTAHFRLPEPYVSTGGLAPGEFLSGGPPGAVVLLGLQRARLRHTFLADTQMGFWGAPVEPRRVSWRNSPVPSSLQARFRAYNVRSECPGKAPFKQHMRRPTGLGAVEDIWLLVRRLSDHRNRSVARGDENCKGAPE